MWATLLRTKPRRARAETLRIRARTLALRALGLSALVALSACSGMSIPTFSGGGNPAERINQPAQSLPAASGRTVGSGPVRVAMLLPLTGDVASVGTSMSNAASLAMDYIASSPNAGNNITLVIKDTQGNPAVASQKASEAVSENASLILGPLKAESVQSAGSVARNAGIPLIGFSNNSGAASPGVYLLNVLPETEVRRSLSFAQGNGTQALAAIVPSNAYGRIQEGAFRQVASELGMTVRAVYQYSTEQEARTAVDQVTPFLEQGSIDGLFIPDRATAPSIGVLLGQAGIAKNNLTIIGSSDWAGDQTIQQTAFLGGAIYPAVDDSGLTALTPQYTQQFGNEPHPFSTLAYTSVLLANSSTLSQSQPRYDQTQLTRPSGFNGRDGLFKFRADGTSQYALTINRVTSGGAQRVDGARIP